MRVACLIGGEYPKEINQVDYCIQGKVQWESNKAIVEIGMHEFHHAICKDRNFM